MSREKTQGKISAKDIVVLGIITALSLITYLLESIFPQIILPGMKLGLSNIYSLFLIYAYSPIYAIISLVIRVVLGNIIVGNLTAMIYGLLGGLISISVMIALERLFFPKISMISISIVGAIVHNVVQNVVYSIIAGNKYILMYMPYLMLFGILSGFLTGLIAYLIFKFIPVNVFNRLLERK